MYAYDGWIHVGNIAGEMKNPQKDLPRAIAGGLIGIMVIYLLVNFVYLHSLPLSAISGNENAASDVAQHIFGGFGGKLITIGILISIYGTLNGYTMTGMRLPYAMALENELPFSKHLVKFYTLVFIAVIKLRITEPDLPRPYKVPLYPVVPIIGIAGGVFIIVMTLISEFQLAMIGLILTLAGLPLYFYMQSRKRRQN